MATTPNSLIADVLLLFPRFPSIFAALWALAYFVDALTSGRESLATVEFLTQTTRAVWALCAFCPYSVLKSPALRRVYLAASLLTAIVLFLAHGSSPLLDRVLMYAIYVTPLAGLLAYRPVCEWLGRSAA